jgi:hypothetical protein
VQITGKKSVQITLDTNRYKKNRESPWRQQPAIDFSLIKGEKKGADKEQ